jgi:hypothetical protein
MNGRPSPRPPARRRVPTHVVTQSWKAVYSEPASPRTKQAHIDLLVSAMDMQAQMLHRETDRRQQLERKYNELLARSQMYKL